MSNEMIFWSPGVTLESIEKDVVLKAFRHYRGNKTATSNALGISIRTLDNKLEKYELDGKEEKLRQENERRNREEWLIKSRGNLHDNVNQTSGHVSQATSGARVESAPQASKESPVSLPQREKVQSVLPTQASAGHSRKAR